MITQKCLFRLFSAFQSDFFPFLYDFNNTYIIERHQAWSEPRARGAQVNVNDPRPFSLDWSDGEDDLVPMKIDFNSSKLVYYMLLSCCFFVCILVWFLQEKKKLISMHYYKAICNYI